MKILAENSNYEFMKDKMASVFQKYDKDVMINKFNLTNDSDYLYICFYARNYRIHRKTGCVSWSDDLFQTENPAGYNEAMTIYDVLCNAKEHCVLTHSWVNVNSLSSVLGGSLPRRNGFFYHEGSRFERKAVQFAQACEALRGRRKTGGDAAYELDMFSFLPVLLRFWDSDEDFPASMQILLDSNVLDFMHYETLMFSITHLMKRLEEEMDHCK